MKLLLISILLLILHIQFYTMEPNPDQSCDNKPPENRHGKAGNSSCNKSKPIEPTIRGNNATNSCRFKATKIAKDAAENTKAVNEAQDAAAEDASKASAASSMADCEQAIVESCAKEIQEAEAVVARNNISLDTSRANAEAACAALRMAKNDTARMQTVLDQLKCGLEDLNTLVNQTHAELEKQSQMVLKYKKRGACLSKELEESKKEYEKVKGYTCRAVSAVLESQRKASVFKSCVPSSVAPVLGNG